ncbi:unnamed protein product [Mycena citricolor]|uniref:Major facilitator superfamily (MFS) profile domain-containing protein n=1 Tax=Mycena citricolor TaxID=2018698 RepID=A0AAD2HAV7_9AGAR|nr:unnamed protein product [Mycena citricolor]
MTSRDAEKTLVVEEVVRADDIASNAVLSEEPYSAFTVNEKWAIVLLIATGAFFSPLSANIYFPVIPTIAKAFHKSIELINLTVTLNMVFQGLTPMIWGSLSDTYGRRHIFISCLVILSLSCVGLALTPTSAYWLLLFLRCFQAAGSASTIALGAGVIGDISTRAERGGFFGLFSIGPMVGPTLGPVLAGVFADKLGWRAIFWFLCISSGICAVVLILFLPETLRTIVGNGSIPPPKIYNAVIPIIGRTARRSPASSSSSTGRNTFQNPLLILLQVDILILLLINALNFAVFYGVTTSISSVFVDAYPHLTDTELGLCFLPIGAGLILGSVFHGKILNWEYRRLKRKAKDVHEDDFPIEKARLRSLPFLLASFVGCTVGYGWCLQAKTHISGPLLLLVGIGLVVISVMNSIQTLMLDLMPSQSSAVTACNNLIRCSLGAGLVSGIAPLLGALRPGFTYLLLGGLAGLMIPVVYLVIHVVGPRWRRKRQGLASGNALALH